MSLSRRHLLAAAAATPFATAATSAVLARRQEEVPDDQKLKWAIAGLGGFAKGQILPNMGKTRWCKPHAFVTGDPVQERSTADQYGVPHENIVGYDEIGKLKEMGIDVLYVITPTGLHEKHTVAGFEAGLHVMCEKPMAQSPEECDRMIAAGEKAGKKLMIGYRCQYEPTNLKAIEWARNEHKGKVQHFAGVISYTQRGQPTWRNDPSMNGGGGSLPDLGLYMLNGSRYIIGEEPTHVTAQTYRPEGNPLFPEGMFARTTWTFKFPSGATSSCVTSYDMNMGNTYRVGCTDGWYELEPATGYHGITMYESGRGGRQKVEIEPPADYVNQFVAEMDHFAECIQNDTDPKTGGPEGRQDVYLIHKIWQAAAEGRTVEV